MTPTPDQVAQWAREAQIAFCLDKYPSFEQALVTRAMAEQAESDAKLCEKQASETSTGWPVNEFTEHAYRDGLLEMMQIPMKHCAATIRANAPKP